MTDTKAHIALERLERHSAEVLARMERGVLLTQDPDMKIRLKLKRAAYLKRVTQERERIVKRIYAQEYPPERVGRLKPKREWR